VISTIHSSSVELWRIGAIVKRDFKIRNQTFILVYVCGRLTDPGDAFSPPGLPDYANNDEKEALPWPAKISAETA
jgi:hypothetical protein